ncbi:hypothetical protein N0V93_001460 [Gnomoniopsis smithogilvyi]|uniref:Uncharacterized protein n=1 Tax=Gnomoniopsis smithogilvyi TaxID=1191159 RepID=A0A9W9D2R2_9PEZI|nr:hypothetical protein N0V93_001460 [Gnomoniopsis smithogilvyi]
MDPYLTTRLSQQASAPAASLPRMANLPQLSNGWQDLDDLSDSEGDGDRSAITVRISTAIRITGDSNIMCMTVSPTETARFVAQAVTKVMRGDGAEQRGGIPMIDEEGRPRPLRIEIEAGTEVHGKGNVLGGEEVVMRALGKRRRDMDEAEEHEEGEEVRRRRRIRHSSV